MGVEALNLERAHLDPTKGDVPKFLETLVDEPAGSVVIKPSAGTQVVDSCLYKSTKEIEGV